VLKAHADLQDGLGNKKRYPRKAFDTFFDAVREYSEFAKDDALIHREVVAIVNGLTEFLRLERKRTPKDVLWKAGRLEALLFAGYDPHFESFEPPEL
jgi:hypothetical protein